MKAIGLALASVLIASILATNHVANGELSNVNVDISETANPGDYLVGITCEDPDYLYTTLLNQGAIVKIDKDSRSVLGIFNDPSGNIASGQDFYSIVRDGSGN